MIFGIDGKILHLKELGFIERMLFEEVLSPQSFYDELIQFINNEKTFVETETLTTKQVLSLDEFVKNYLAPRIEETKIWLLRAYILGEMLTEMDLTQKIFNLPDVANLPKTVIEYAKKYNLSIEEAKAINAAVEEGAALMQNSTLETVNTVRNAMVENYKKRGNAKSLEELLREKILDDPGELNRDWKKVAITESNNIFNNGILGKLKDGDFVTGISAPDACDGCLENISGQVFRVRKEPPPPYDNLDPDDDKYQEIAEIWENYVWVGKNNYGRSNSRQKRINPAVGNKKDNLREKYHHEHSTPALPQHPNCRCYWKLINIEWQYIDSHGIVRLRSEDEDEWMVWRNEIAERFNIDKVTW